jgi:hypothetical protein
MLPFLVRYWKGIRGGMGQDNLAVKTLN